MMLANRKKIELTITGLGIILFIFLIINHIPKSKDSNIVSRVEPYVASESAIMAASKTKSGNYVKWGRDPFLLDASNVKEQSIENLALNGIVSDKQNPYAVINNDIVKLGDKVKGMTVIEINEKSVVLEQNGQKHTLELNVY